MMLCYKKCPLKKRPIFYEIDDDHIVVENNQPQDLSVKRKLPSADEDHDKNFQLNLSTNSYYDQIRQSSKIFVYDNNANGSESPRSFVSESSYKYQQISSPIYYSDIQHNDIHLKDLNSNYVPYLMPSPSPPPTSMIIPSQRYPDYNSYNLTPPSSPLSYELSEPEDLSIRHCTIPMPSEVKTFYQQQQQQQHKRSIKLLKANRFNCDKCPKSYSTNTGLSKHQQFHCPSAECNQVKKDFACENCEKVYTTLGALKMHIRTHTLPCKCPLCGKAFSRPWLLQGHIRTHTGEKPFSCQHCNRAFADRSNLRAHQQTHVDVKKYICDVCHKSFSRMSLLTKHLASGNCCSNSSSGFTT